MFNFKHWQTLNHPIPILSTEYIYIPKSSPSHVYIGQHAPGIKRGTHPNAGKPSHCCQKQLMTPPPSRFSQRHLSQGLFLWLNFT